MSTKEFCSFYVSEAHLVTMLLPYMKKKMNEKYEIRVFSENDLSNIAKKVIDNMMNLEEKEKLRKISWKSSKYKFDLKRKYLIIIAGTEEYMKKIKKEIDKKSDDNIIISCYEFDKSEEEILEILENHDKVINTKGEAEKEKLFTQFTQKPRKGNKEITIMK